MRSETYNGPMPPYPREADTDIELKTHPEYFEDVLANRKRYEIRIDDRPFAVGSVLHLREWDPAKGATQSSAGYTGRSCRRRVLSLMRDFHGLEKGYVLLSIAPLADDDQAQRVALAAANDNATARARELAVTQRELEKARAADRETSRVFDRMWNADQRAIRDWQAAHLGNDRVWPDRAKLATWIIPRLQAAEDMLEQIYDYAYDHSTGPAVPDHLWHIRGLAQAVISPVDHERERVVAAMQTPPLPPRSDGQNLNDSLLNTQSELKDAQQTAAQLDKACKFYAFERDRLAARVTELEKVDAWHRECMAYCATGPAGVIHTIKSIHERMLHAEREVARLASSLAWIPVTQELPPLDDNPVGGGAAAGWSRWLECQNDQDTTSDGPIVFTAAYSYILKSWQRLRDSDGATVVTHWRRYQPVKKA